MDYQHPRGLQEATMLELAACRWVEAHQNVIFSGPTGVGKSHLACGLGQKACREGYSVVYRRASRFYDERAQSRADGTYFLVLRRLAVQPALRLLPSSCF
jgi:DNA replication protein DnaC